MNGSARIAAPAAPHGMSPVIPPVMSEATSTPIPSAMSPAMSEVLRDRRAGCLFFALAAACAVLESVPSFDVFFQSPFFSADGWLLSKPLHQRLRGLLYTGPKVLIAVTGAFFLLLFCASLLSGLKERLRPWQKPALFVALGIASVPLAVGALKMVTGVYSPVDLALYGGDHEFTGIARRILSLGMPGGIPGGRSFPAGHASGGFALMALGRLPLSRRARGALFFFGLCCGWLMGVYQMARGEHFVSHTLCSMFLALGILSFLASRLAPRLVSPSALRRDG